MKKPNTPGDVDHSIFLARNTIIDKILAAVIIAGTIAATIVIWRDTQTGIDISNSWSNFTLLVILSITWLFRKSLPIQAKSAILFFGFLVITLKSFFNLAAYGGGVLYMSYLCLLIVLSVGISRSIVYSALLSLIIPVAAYLYFTDHIVIEQDFGLLLNTPAVWVTDYVNFMFTAFIIIMGVGQLRKELNNNFLLLRSTITDLEKTNKTLKREIETKEQYQRELKVSEEKYRTIFESSSDGVVLMDANRRVLEANAACLELSGYTLEEFRGIDVFDLIHPRYRELAKSRYQELLSGNFLDLAEIQAIRKDGKEITIEMNTNLIVIDDGLLILTTIRDISLRKSLEYDKYNAEIKAEEKERARFSKDLHDDLGPLLSTLKLYLQTLNNKTSNAEHNEIINKAAGIVDSGVKMIREISHNLSPYLLREKGLKDAIKFHLDNMKTTDQLQAGMHVDNMENCTLEETVKIVIYRIFLELLNNTIKHSEATEVKIHLLCRENVLTFLYIDNGKGFDTEFVEKNFQDGIGLKNMLNRINALKGDISFRRENRQMITDIKIPLE